MPLSAPPLCCLLSGFPPRRCAMGFTSRAPFLDSPNSCHISFWRGRKTELVCPFDWLEQQAGSSTRTKRSRAKTVGKRVASLAPGDKLTVVFDLAHRLIGDYKPDYVTRQGVVVQNMHITSLAYKSWHRVPQETKQKMVDVVLDRFNIGPETGRLNLLIKSLGKKWNDYRSELKVLYYDKCGPDKNRLKNRPLSVSESDWIWLVRYWGYEDVHV